MADWKTVRYDEAYEEKIDPEIIPLCDALNDAGFETTSSCWGHTHDWPHVWWKDDGGIRSEALARFLLKSMDGDFRPFFPVIQKDILIKGHLWSLELHHNEVYQNTPIAEVAKKYIAALEKVTTLVREFARFVK